MHWLRQACWVAAMLSRSADLLCLTGMRRPLQLLMVITGSADRYRPRARAQLTIRLPFGGHRRDRLQAAGSYIPRGLCAA